MKMDLAISSRWKGVYGGSLQHVVHTGKISNDICKHPSTEMIIWPFRANILHGIELGNRCLHAECRNTGFSSFPYKSVRVLFGNVAMTTPNIPVRCMCDMNTLKCVFNNNFNRHINDCFE